MFLLQCAFLLRFQSKMVCLPCFVIPALLFIFRVIIQPLIYRFWGRRIQEPALSCPMPQKKKIKTDNLANSSTNAAKEVDASTAEETKKNE